MRKALLFAFIAFGFAPITFLVSDASLSRSVTIVYRATVVIFCIVEFILDLQSKSTKNTGLTKFRQEKDRLIDRGQTPSYDNNTSTAKIGLFIFISIYSLRLLHDVINDSTNQLLTKEPQEYLLMWFLVSLIPAFYFMRIHSQSDLRLCLYTSYLALVIASILSISVQSSSTLFQVQGRLASEVINPVSVGHIGTSLASLSIFIFFNSHANLSNSYVKFICIVWLMVGLYILYLSASRGPFLGFIIINFFSAISYFRNRDSRKNGLLLLSIIALSSAVAFTTGSINPDSAFFSRVIGLDDGKNIDYTSQSNEGRQDFFTISINLILKSIPNLFCGFGIELPGLGYPHNVILEAFISTGIFGGFIFTMLYAYVLFRSIILVLNQDIYQYSWLGIICIQYLVSGLLSGNLYQGTVLWYFIFAIVAYGNSVSLHKSSIRTLKT